MSGDKKGQELLEAYRRKKQAEQAQMSDGQTNNNSGAALLQKYKQQQAAKKNAEGLVSEIDTWFKESAAVNQDYNNWYKNGGISQSDEEIEQAYSDVKSRRDTLIGQSTSIKNRLWQCEDIYGKEMVDKLTGQIDSMIKGNTATLDAWANNKSRMGTYRTAKTEADKAGMTIADPVAFYWNQKSGEESLQGLLYEDYANPQRIQDTKKLTDFLDKWTAYEKGDFGVQGLLLGAVEKDSVDSKDVELKKAVDAYAKRNDTISDLDSLLGEGKSGLPSSATDLSDIDKMTDEQKLAYIFSPNSVYSTVTRTELQREDLSLYDKHQLLMQKGYSTQAIDTLLDFMVDRGEMSSLDKIKLQSVMAKYKKQQDMVDQQVEFAQDHPVVSSAMSIPLNVGGGFTASIEDMQSFLSPDGIDPYSDGNTMQASAEAIRETVSDKIDNSFLQFLYQSGMSAADSTFTSAMGMGLGVPEVSIILMSSGAAASTIRSAKKRGLSDDRAMATGVAAGISEALFEYVSLENLKQVKSFLEQPAQTLGKKILKVAAQSGIEGTEELFTDIANCMTDLYINGGEAEIAQNIDAYEAKGMSEEEAIKKALGDFAVQLGLSFAGGALSGSMMSGSMAVVSRTSNRALGKSVRTSGYTQALVDMANELVPDGKYTKLVQEQLSKGDGVSDATLGKLMKEVMPAYKESVQTDVCTHLEQAGINADMAESIAQKLVDGEQISRSEADILRQNAAARAYMRDGLGVADIDEMDSAGQIGQALRENAWRVYSVQTALDAFDRRVATAAAERTRAGGTDTTTGTMPVTDTNSGEQSDAGDNVALRDGYAATVWATGEPVTVTGIDAVSDGRMKVALSDGDTMELADLELEDAALASVLNAAAEYPTATARAFVSGYDKALPLNTYKTGFDYIRQQAMNGMSYEQAVKTGGAFVQQMSVAAQQNAYAAGLNEANRTVDTNKNTNSVQDALKGKENILNEIGGNQDERKERNDGQGGSANGSDTLSDTGYRRRATKDNDGKSRKAGADKADYSAGQAAKRGRRTVQQNDREVIYTGKEEADFTPRQKRAADICRQNGRELHVFQREMPVIVDGAEFYCEQVAFSVPGTNLIFIMDGQNVDAIYHEMFHLDLSDGKESAIQLLNTVKKRIDPDSHAFAFYVQNCIDLYAGEADEIILDAAYESMVTDAIALVSEEVAADVQQYAYIKTPVVTERLIDLFGSQNVLDDIAEQAVAWKQKESGFTNGETGSLRFSVNKQYAQDITQWDRAGRPKHYTFDLGTTGDVLQGLGAIENDIYMHGDKISSILSKHTEMNLDVIKKIPEILETPILVLKSKTREKGNSRIVMFGNVTAENGKPVLCVMDLLPVENHIVVDDMQKVVSAYTKTNSSEQIKNFLNNSEVLYTSKNKKVAAKLLRTIGFYMPIELQQSGYIGSISYRGQNVNITGKKFSDVFAPKTDDTDAEIIHSETDSIRFSMDRSDDTDFVYMQAVKNGDIDTAQQLVDTAAKAAGYTIRAYHGTNTDFSVFDKDYLGSSSNHGTGTDYGFFFGNEYDYSLYWAENASHLKGKPIVLDVYLKINNPIEYDDSEYNDGGFTLEKKIEDAYYSNGEYDGVIANNLFDDESRQGRTAYVIFDSNQVKSADPVVYDDNGKVIPLSKRFDVKQDDIRFSMEKLSETDYDRLIQENTQLHEQVDILRQEFALTNGHQLSKKAIDTMAGKLLRQYSSLYDRQILVNNLTNLFDYIANGNEINYDEVMQIATDIAYSVLQESGKKNTALYERYADMREYLRHTKIRLSDNVQAELKAAYDGYENFRRKNFGSLRLTNDGVSLDSLWPEISDRWPEFFPDDASEYDQPLLLVDALNTVKPFIENPYEMNMQEIAADMALQLFDGYFDIPEVKTFADKQQVKMTALRVQYADRMREMRQAYKARYDEQLQQVKKDNIERRQALAKKIRDTENQKRKEQLMKQYRRLTDSKQEALERQKAKYEKRVKQQRSQKAILDQREKIKRVAGRMKKLLISGTDLRHIPEGFRVPVARLLNMLDFSTDRMVSDKGIGKVLKDLHTAYEKIGNEQTGEESAMHSYYDVQVADALEEVARVTEGKRIADLGLNDLQKVYASLRSMETIVRNVNKMFFDEQKTTVTQAGRDTMRSLNLQKAKKSEKVKGVNKFLNEDMLTPYYFFKQFEGSPMETAFKNLYEGENIYIRSAQKGQMYAQKQMKDYGITEKILMELSDVQTSDGVVQMTLGERLSLYATYKREAQSESHHLDKGGFQIKEQKSVRRSIPELPMRFLQADFLLLESQLTNQQKAFADSMISFLSTECANWGNEVTMKMLGIKKYREKYYIPFKTIGEAVVTNPGEGGDIRLKNASYSKSRVKGATSSLSIDDFMSVWATHVEQMAMYNAFVLPLEDITRLWNYKEYGDPRQTVKTAIRRMLGDNANDYISNFLKDLNGGVEIQAGTEWFSKWISKFKKTAVSANLSVAIQQPTAILRATAMLSWKYVGNSTWNVHKMLKEYEEAKQYVPVYILKEWGYFDTNMNRGLHDRVMQEEYQGIGKIKGFLKDRDYRSDAMGLLAQKGDEIAWGKLWNAVKRETIDLYPEVEKRSDAFYKLASERVTDIIRGTQVYDSVFKRSQIMRSKDKAAVMATSFMAEPTLNYNLLWEAQRQIRSGTKSGRKAGVRNIQATVAGMLAAALASALIYALRDNDDEKKDENGNVIGERTYWDKFNDAAIDNIISAPLNLLPFVKDIVSLAQGYDVTRTDMLAFDKLFSALDKVYSDNYTTAEKIDAVAGAVATLCGEPLANISRDVKALYNTFLSDPNVSANYRYYQMYTAIINGDGDAYEEAIQKLTDEGKEESEIMAGLRKAMTAHDIRIAEAGLSYAQGDVSVLADTISSMEQDGFDREQVAKAIRSYSETLKTAAEYKESGHEKKYQEKLDDLCGSGIEQDTVEQVLEKISATVPESGQVNGEDNTENKKITSIYTSEDICKALDAEDMETLTEILNDKFGVGEANGMEEKDTVSNIRKGLTSYYKPLYQEAYQNKDDESMRNIRLILTSKVLKQYGIKYTPDDFSQWIKDMKK